jgi:predicted transcriptional regulator
VFSPISYIKGRRERLWISQVKLAELSGISRDIVSRIESSKISEPSYMVVKKLFEGLEWAVAKMNIIQSMR